MLYSVLAQDPIITFDVTQYIAVLAVACWLSATQKGLTKKVIPLAWGVMMFSAPMSSMDWYMIAVGIFILLLAVLIVNLNEASK